MKLNKDIFRAYDIRGIVGQGIDQEIIYHIGRAIGTLLSRSGGKQILTARDARLSSPTLIESLRHGLMDCGIEVTDVDIVPTPLLYYATHATAIHSGVMLTASHNPSNYNGLKIVLNGSYLSQEIIQTIYKQIESQDYVNGKGSLIHVDITESYIQRILSDTKIAKPIKVVIDCGNGVAGKIAPTLFQRLGCEVVPLHCDLDGYFPNHHPDPSCQENMTDLCHAVKSHQADLGIAFDGDGDRLGVVTDKGEIIWPDRLLMLFAKDILSRHKDGTLLFDVKCTRLLTELINSLGGKAIMWKTGHSFIKQKMLDENALLAGEMSGHIFFKERWYGFDDGLYAGARLVEILSNSSLSITEVFADFPESVNTPEIKVSLPEDKKFTFVENFKSQAKFSDGNISLIDGLRIDFKDGWGLVRSSNTTPCIVLRFEANDQHSLTRIQTLFKEQLLAVDETLQLPF